MDADANADDTAPMMLAASLTVLCGLLVVAQLVFEARGHARGRAVTKVLASLSFLALIALGAPAGAAPATPLFTAIAAGLVLGALGDVALLGQRSAAFLAGLVAFLLGHVAYVVAFAWLSCPGGWLTPWSALPVLLAAGALVWLVPHVRRNKPAMLVPVLVYVAVITLMVIAALAAAQPATGPAPLLTPTRRWIFLVGGAVLFFASDLFVARNRFVAPGLVNRLLGLPAYYGGQVLIAWGALLSR